MGVVVQSAKAAGLGKLGTTKQGIINVCTCRPAPAAAPHLEVEEQIPALPRDLLGQIDVRVHRHVGQHHCQALGHTAALSVAEKAQLCDQQEAVLELLAEQVAVAGDEVRVRLRGAKASSQAPFSRRTRVASSISGN